MVSNILFSQTRLALKHATSVPRLELNAALLTRATQKILMEILVPVDSVFYYSDSTIVLGYLKNDSKRFYVYVANRVEEIRRATETNQWLHIDTLTNPSDMPS